MTTETNTNVAEVKKTALVESVKNIAPLAYLTIVFWGLLYETVYFHFFDINIVNYIDLSEILLVLYDDFLIAVLCVGMGAVLSMGIIKIPLEVGSMLASKIRKRDINLNRYFLVAAIGLGMIFLLIGVSQDLHKLNMFSVAVGAIGVASLENKIDKDVKAVLLVILLVFMTMLLAAASYQNARQAMVEKLEVNIIWKDHPVWPVDFHLVGETRNYIFLYSADDQKTTAYNRDQVKSISFKRTKNIITKYFGSAEQQK